MGPATWIMQSWLPQIGHACLWGSLLVAGVGVVCRCLPRLPAAVRAWFWWLACAKLLLDLCVMAPINLPLLPAPAPAVHTALTAAAMPHSLAAPTLPQPIPAAAPAAAEVAPTAVSAPSAPRWPSLLFGLWIAGVTASFGFIAYQSIALKRLQRGAFSVPLPDANLDTLAQQMGLKCAPRVLTGPPVRTPCVTGWLRPVILLPLNFSETLTTTELRLTLAHEMAHLKRGDLPLAVVPLLARTLFFFHPLAWWAAAEWAAAREEACDALALSATHLPPAEYGRLLLKLAAPTAAPPALGFSPGFHALHRRLVQLSSARLAPRRARLLALALPLLLPWRLSAALTPSALSQDKTPTLYSVTALADGSEVAALNNAGQVALSVHADDGAQGYAGTADTLTALPALPKHHASLVYGLSDAGQAAGASFNILGHARAFWWDGVTHKIGSLPGYPYSEARGINTAGEIAGFSETGHADRFRAWMTRAFLHRPREPLTDLGTLGGLYSAAYAVNSLGAVVGKADTDTVGATHAFAWTSGDGMADLGTLGGANSVAYAVSDTGQITGASDTDAAGTRHAFLYALGQMQDLAPLPGLTGSAAYALNASGQVVGISQNGTLKRATLWQNGEPTDLNTLLPARSGWTFTEARAINDHGQIAGLGLFQGHPRAFLLTPR